MGEEIKFKCTLREVIVVEIMLDEYLELKLKTLKIFNIQ